MVSILFLFFLFFFSDSCVLCLVSFFMMTTSLITVFFSLSSRHRQWEYQVVCHRSTGIFATIRNKKTIAGRAQVLAPDSLSLPLSLSHSLSTLFPPFSYSSLSLLLLYLDWEREISGLASDSSICFIVGFSSVWSVVQQRQTFLMCVGHTAVVRSFSCSGISRTPPLELVVQFLSIFLISFWQSFCSRKYISD